MYKRHTQVALESHQLNVTAITSNLLTDSSSQVLHINWVCEHFPWGKACNSLDKDCVAYTLCHLMPPYVIGLLPTQDYSEDVFEELCTDLSDISSQDLYYAWCDHTDINAAICMLLICPQLHVQQPVYLSAPQPYYSTPSRLRNTLL